MANTAGENIIMPTFPAMMKNELNVVVIELACRCTEAAEERDWRLVVTPYDKSWDAAAAAAAYSFQTPAASSQLTQPSSTPNSRQIPSTSRQHARKTNQPRRRLVHHPSTVLRRQKELSRCSHHRLLGQRWSHRHEDGSHGSTRQPCYTTSDHRQATRVRHHPTPYMPPSPSMGNTSKVSESRGDRQNGVLLHRRYVASFNFAIWLHSLNNSIGKNYQLNNRR